MNVYVRESCRDERQYPYRVNRFPYARYDRQRFRMCHSFVRIYL
jgi:hypothetical protein